MLSQEEFINKLFNNKLSDFVNFMENEYQELLKTHSKEIKKVELDMNEFVKGNSPDYISFMSAKAENFCIFFGLGIIIEILKIVIFKGSINLHV